MTEEKDKRELVFRLFEANEIQVRAGQMTKDKSKIALLLYQDARAAMNRLDERFGEYGWQREHKEVNGACYCGVSLWDDDKKCWVTKWDAGEASNPQTSPKKSEASDSFKRACVNWGIGRELYTGPRMYVPSDTDTFSLSVRSISYNENREICALTIADRKGNIIYSYPKENASNRVKTEQKPQQAQQVTHAPQQQPADGYVLACREVDKCTTRQQVIDVYYKYEKCGYGQKVFDYAQSFLNSKGL